MREDRPFYKLSTFVEDPRAKIITGPRRLSKTKLLDEIELKIREMCPSSNIIRINNQECTESNLKDQDEALRIIYSRLKKEQRNYILIDEANTTFNWEAIAEKIVGEGVYEIEVYCGQDLCHQVPACIKWINKEV
ncbi:hypothetical protein A3206_06720 [Candidatus Methanomassiliicoccus intestinalis]|uniref:ATPase n=2 Tax=Candidatus Methanomassiliicoccus intestinalis TaxID=1406512 RepID=R9T5A4_METII|nr:AAA family ATPase [Candidatus Methanomassiliicoccus intestinalis]AGN25915.1 ATPase [Candidatus Methanomassiliicoccus intestinalis Issoire-Mx1]TQS83330.1 MAG: hypothetical protein A3206_06720 [Candidatus Methanomassiliicoccus intestinalis]